MRRSLDFGTLTGSLSTLKSSRSNGDSNSNGCTINGTTHSASPSGSRFGTVAGIPTSDAGSLSNDHFKRPRSALSSGWERAARNGGGRRGFALGSLFGGSGSGQQETIHDDSTSKAAHLHASESITDVQHHSSLDPANTPPTPDTPAEREHALMLAVQAAKAKDQAWQIVVQPAPSEGLFLEYANGRNNKLGKTPRHEVGTNRGASFPSSSSNAMLAGLSGRARRLLGRTGDKSMAIASNLSPTSEEVVASSATIAADSSQGATSKHLNGASETRGPQTSAAKRPLEASEDNMNSLPVSMSSAPAVPTCDDLQPATNTPVSDVMTALLPASTHVNQLLVLYVTTGSSSLTLYRTVGQLVKLDEELRRHFSDDMPTTPRPSVLSSPTAKYVTSPTPNYGHARRKSVLASLTRTFTSPTLSRKKAPLSMQSSQASIAEEELESAESHMSPSTSFPAANDTASPSEEQPHVNLSVQSPQLPILQSQLSNLSDYLSSLSSVAVIRGSRQWTAFFKPGKADHESARLGALPHLPRTMSKGKRLKRMKSEGGLETRSPMSSPPDLMPSTPHGMLVTTPERKEVRIDDSGIGVDSLGHYSSRHNGPLGRGHPTESSTNSSSATSHSASTHMQRVASDGTDTSVSSAMSVFVEHTDGTGQDTGVGDPEVLAYMERLRQESETRGTYTKIPLDVKTDTSRKEGKSSKSTIVEHIPTTSSFSASNMVGQDLNHTPPALLPDSLQHENPILSVPSLSDEPILSALEESMTAATPIYEAEEAHLPPLSGATIVASEGSPTQLVGSSSNEDMEQEHAVADYLSPTTAVVDNFDGSSTGPSSLTGRIPSLTGRKKRSTSSMRRCRKSSVANTSVSHRTGSHKPSVRIEDFEILRVLGKGCAGKVLLARLKDMTFMSAKGRDSSLYAIKAIHKHHVLAHRELAHTLTEQSILKKMATDTPNPFVVKMRWSFQDNDNLFLVLDFHSGGDLATQLSRWGRLGKDRTRFYAAEIIEGLESLHNAGVIYRDLKPENILLAADGHIVLTDFGLSKQFHRAAVNGETGAANEAVSPTWMSKTVQDSKSRQTSPVIGAPAETTTTFCGTAEYLAPEVLLGHAYSYPVDMWSLGTMIYEMLLGVTPFYNEDHSIMYRRVLHEQLDFGSGDYLDGDTRALLRGLLQKEPEFRMTTSRVKRSKYFEAIDWAFVNNKRYIPPFIPNLSPDDPADTQNFEECFLTMDLGFVDPKDTEEIDLKAKTSGKEPDKAFDEHGRDVFADYSFDGAWADPESQEDDDHSGSDAAISEEEEDQCSEDESEERHTPEVDSTASPHATSDLGKKIVERNALTSSDFASRQEVKDVGEAEAATDVKQTNGPPPVLIVPIAGISAAASAIQQSKDQGEGAKTANGPSSTSTDRLGMRNSVEMPRMASPAEMSDEGLPRMSAEQEDWDVVESLDTGQSVDNGPKGPRKRLLAGTNLFAKGVVDKYKMQLKPLARLATPTRSYTARSPISRLASGSVQPSRSNKTSNQLSPTPSIGGMSESPSSVESSDQAVREAKNIGKVPGRRLITPRLLRASSDWMSSSLPSSPTPRFRMRRNKKGTGPEPTSSSSPGDGAPASGLLEAVPATPDSSLDSNATLPIEQASKFGLQPLTRQVSNERYLPNYNDGSPKPNTATPLLESGR